MRATILGPERGKQEAKTEIRILLIINGNVWWKKVLEHSKKVWKFRPELIDQIEDHKDESWPTSIPSLLNHQINISAIF